MSGTQRSITFYLVTLLLFGGLIYYVVTRGEGLRPHLAEQLTVAAQGVPEGTAMDQFQHTVSGNMQHALAVLLMQIVAIIAVARVFAYLFTKIGQPTVIGEIVAGIVLGPSVVGYWFPGISEFLFPAGSLGNLQFMSQIGLVLFMFVIGMELDLGALSGRAKDAVVISHASIVIPYALGVGLSYWLYLDFAPPTISFVSFALFMGIAMSITAFPVLARIVQERGLSRQHLGSVVITCAAADDVTAWCILAAVIAIVKAGSAISALYTIAAALIYVAVMLGVLRPFLRRLGEAHADRAVLGRPILLLVLLVMLASAWTTEVIGIHALFGAFLAGVIMPPNLTFRRLLVGKLEDVSVALLLPLFFVFTGLRTRVGLLSNEHLWGVCALVCAVAVVGKFGGSTLAARFVGNNWKDSLSIGALMNTRGLMELVVLNIGYDLGVLNAEIFAMMVLMALTTTFMTGPALSLIERVFRSSADATKEVAMPGWRVLLSFGQPASGQRALRLVRQLAGEEHTRAVVTALHVTPSSDVNPIDSDAFERDGFKPVLREAERQGIPVRTEHRVAADVGREILQQANTGGFDLLLVGAGKPLLKGTILGDLLGFTSRVMDPSKLIGSITGRESLLPSDDQIDPRVRQLIEEAQCSVGVFMDKGFAQAGSVLVVLGAPGDLFLLHYAERLLQGEARSLTLLDTTGLVHRDPSFRNGAQRLQQIAPESASVISNRAIDASLMKGQDLLLTSYKGWARAAESRAAWLADVPSTLILRP